MWPFIRTLSPLHLAFVATVGEDPAPLFSTSTITGGITLADSVADGMSFGCPSVIGAILDFGGIRRIVADIQAEIAPSAIPPPGLGIFRTYPLSMDAAIL